MRLLLSLFCPYLIFAFCCEAMGGAISAGGMQAPAMVECLFNDPSNHYAPFNLIIFNSDNVASLVEVDLKTRVKASSFAFETLVESSKGGLHSYRGTARDESLRINVEINEAESLSFDQYVSLFESYINLEKVSFTGNLVGYRASLSTQGRRLEGICTKGDLFHYWPQREP